MKLTCPPVGKELARIRYFEPEFGLLAFLSGDEQMIEDYQSYDPYRQTAINVMRRFPGGEIIHWDTASPEEIDRLSRMVIAVCKGVNSKTLDRVFQGDLKEAAEVIMRHRCIYPKYSRYVQESLRSWSTELRIKTRLGWTIRAGRDIDSETGLCLFAQSQKAEILRLASTMCLDAGVQVLAITNDGLIVEGDCSNFADELRGTKLLMKEASAQLLGGALELTIGVQHTEDSCTNEFCVGHELIPNQWARFSHIFESPSWTGFKLVRGMI